MRPIDSHFSGLGFLLSLGALPIAGCPAGDDADTNASNPTTNNTANTVSASDDTAGTNPTTGMSASDDTAGTNPTDSADTGMTSVSTDTDPTGLDTGTGGLPEECVGLPIPPACTDVMNKYIECYPQYARYYANFEAYCACGLSYYLPMYGAGCAGAQEDLYACIAGLSCEELMGKTSCEAEHMAFDTECFGGATSTGEGGTTDNDTGGGMTDPATGT